MMFKQTWLISLCLIITGNLCMRLYAFTTLPTHYFSVRNSILSHSTKLNDDDEQQNLLTDFSSKGFVSSLTSIVNFVSPSRPKDQEMQPPPSTPTLLLESIRDDYQIRNYLWTGDVELGCYENECKFTDPTISFEGKVIHFGYFSFYVLLLGSTYKLIFLLTFFIFPFYKEQYVKNIQNLRPIIDALIEPGECQSDLLRIDLNDSENYVQTRWKMVGNLSRLPWKPNIDVIGRTKFWYRDVDNGVRVYFYDEEWEIPVSFICTTFAIIHNF